MGGPIIQSDTNPKHEGKSTLKINQRKKKRKKIRESNLTHEKDAGSEEDAML